MGSSVRPERPPLSAIVERVDRPKLADIVAKSPDDILAAMNESAARSKRESDRLAANARDRKLEGWDAVGAIAQRFSDAGTFGVSGLLDDALSAIGDGTFRANREARRMASEGLSGTARVASTVAGAITNPVTTLARPFQGAGLLARTGNSMVNTGAQAGAIGATENLMEFTPQGLLDAGMTGAGDAVMGALLGGAGSLLFTGAKAVNTMRRVKNAKPLDEAAFARADAMKKADEALYGAVRQEAGAAGTTPAIREVLESKTVKPFADMIRKSETWAGADDATVLTEAYKLMSRAQRRSGKSIEGTAEHLADLELKNADIGLAKGRMMKAATEPGLLTVPGRAVSAPAPSTAQSPHPSVRDAIEAMRTRSGQVVTRKEGTAMQQTAREALERHDAENIVSPSLTGAPSPMRTVIPGKTIPIPGALPTFPKAVETHRIAAGEMDAFNQTADAVRDILSNKSVKGKKLLIESPEALRRAIKEMTPAEAEAALEATLGRTREIFRLTSNPIGKFGLAAATARAVRAPFKIDPYVKLLEAQAGRKPTGLLSYLFSPPSRQKAQGVLGITVGGSNP